MEGSNNTRIKIQEQVAAERTCKSAERSTSTCYTVAVPLNLANLPKQTRQKSSDRFSRFTSPHLLLKLKGLLGNCLCYPPTGSSERPHDAKSIHPSIDRRPVGSVFVCPRGVRACT
jgi:hypothetical protein